MNLKSLFLSTTAAMMAVSGAQAADVIVPVAPDPVDSVRVCDVYGTGFFYIPGTETCLSIGGYVRFRYAAIDNQASYQDNARFRFASGAPSSRFNNDGDDYTAGSSVRVRLNFDAREETELGTLRAFARIQSTNVFGVRVDNPYSMDLGYIQLGGLTMGYLDSLWTDGDGLFTDTDLPVGDFQTNRVSYTYASDGFSAAVSLEDDGTGNFAPDVVARVAYDAGFASVYLAGSYDESVSLQRATPIGFNVGNNYGFVPYSSFGLDPRENDGGFAVKGAVTVKPFENAQFKVEGSYAFDPSIYSTIALFSTTRNVFLDYTNNGVPVEWQAGAGYQQSFGKLAFAASGVFGETFDTFGPNLNGSALRNFGKGDYYKVAGNVGYAITNNFDVLGEVTYTSVDFDTGNNLDQTTGFVQFVRSF